MTNTMQPSQPAQPGQPGQPGHPAQLRQRRTGRSPLLTRLDALHDEYVDRINRTQSDPSLGERVRDDEVARLAAAYDEDAVRLVAEHEGRTDLLPLRTQTGKRYGVTTQRTRRLSRSSRLTR